MAPHSLQNLGRRDCSPPSTYTNLRPRHHPQRDLPKYQSSTFNFFVHLLKTHPTCSSQVEPVPPQVRSHHFGHLGPNHHPGIPDVLWCQRRIGASDPSWVSEALANTSERQHFACSHFSSFKLNNHSWKLSPNVHSFTNTMG